MSGTRPDTPGSVPYNVFTNKKNKKLLCNIFDFLTERQTESRLDVNTLMKKKIILKIKC